jgi:hypothetical protein
MAYLTLDMIKLPSGYRSLYTPSDSTSSARRRPCGSAQSTAVDVPAPNFQDILQRFLTINVTIRNNIYIGKLLWVGKHFLIVMNACFFLGFLFLPYSARALSYFAYVNSSTTSRFTTG